MGGIKFHILCVGGMNFTIHMLGETLKSIMVSLPIKFVDLGEGRSGFSAWLRKNAIVKKKMVEF